MSDKENKFFATGNPNEGASAIDQPEVEGHRYFLANEDSNERIMMGTDQPEVEGHRMHATEDGPDDARFMERAH
ncbi:MAG: hypothetical protein M3Q71_11385 [Chloroflexota bacterium]|nr:hypothetical protein [Chloroflexota bacterium]